MKDLFIVENSPFSLLLKRISQKLDICVTNFSPPIHQSRRCRCHTCNSPHFHFFHSLIFTFLSFTFFLLQFSNLHFFGLKNLLKQEKKRKLNLSPPIRQNSMCRCHTYNSPHTVLAPPSSHLNKWQFYLKKQMAIFKRSEYSLGNMRKCLKNQNDGERWENICAHINVMVFAIIVQKQVAVKTILTFVLVLLS